MARCAQINGICWFVCVAMFSDAGAGTVCPSDVTLGATHELDWKRTPNFFLELKLAAPKKFTQFASAITGDIIDIIWATTVPELPATWW